MGPIYNVLVTRHHGRNGIEVLIDSLASDGSKSWVVIRRGVGLCVTELPTECTRSMHADICAGVNAAQSAERPAIDMAQHAQSSAASRSSCDARRMPITLRKWHRVSCVDEVVSQFPPIWKRTIVILLHPFSMRAQDECVHWNTQMQNAKGFREQFASWTFDD